MRTREEIEKELKGLKKHSEYNYINEQINYLILEVLLDIREQNEREMIVFNDEGYSSYTIRVKK